MREESTEQEDWDACRNLIALGAAMREDPLLVKDLRYRTRKYRRCFRGDDAVVWLVDHGYAEDFGEALKVGTQMFNLGLFVHVHADHKFKNERLFYRFIEDGGSSGRHARTQGRSAAAQQHSDLGQDDALRDGMERAAERVEEHSPTALGGPPCNRGTFFLLLSLFILQVTPVSWNGSALWGFRRMWEILIVLQLLRYRSRVASSGPRKAQAAGHKSVVRSKGLSSDDSSQSDQDELPSRTRESPGVAVSRMRDGLRGSALPFEEDIFTNSYVETVMMQPTSKGCKRTYRCAQEKLVRVQEWREAFGCSKLPRLAPEYSLEALKDVQAIVKNESYLYWRGFDLERRPILWVRPAKKDWHRITDEDILHDLQYHAIIFDMGIRHMMAEGICQFSIVADASDLGPSQFNIAIIKRLVEMATIGYPDRVASIIVTPVPALAKTAFYMIKPFLPANLQRKIALCGRDAARERLHRTVADPSVIPLNLLGKGVGSAYAGASDLPMQIEDQRRIMASWP